MGTMTDAAVLTDVRAVVHSYPGSAPLELRWHDGNGTRATWRSRSLTLSADGAALSELRGLLGHDRVSIVLGV
jgi:hypothetical protein